MGRHVDTTRNVDTPAPCHDLHWGTISGQGGYHRKPGVAN